MRGDRPRQPPYTTRGRRATPHARGSTIKNEFGFSSSIGYPACAGIDLFSNRIYLLPQWLPRMRGDRPEVQDILAKAKEATPHARGSTGSFLDQMEIDDGYPACAGIDLINAMLSHPCPGYPACAGIDPKHLAWRTSLQRLPRMRGDRPQRSRFPRRLPTATPHARGSTPGNPLPVGI